MPRQMRRALGVVLAAMFSTQPALAIAHPPALSCPASVVPGERPPVGERVTPEAPPAQPPDRTSSKIDPGRQLIARQMTQLGYEPQAARAAASRLTAADLEVLLANPEMMQAAGALSATAQANIMGILIVGGIVALGIAGSASVMIN